MTLESCPVCLTRLNGVKMKEHLKTCHPKYSPSAGAAKRKAKTAAAAAAASPVVYEEWVACGVCGHAVATRAELIRHSEMEHLRGDSPHNLRMSLKTSEDVRAIKVELKRTSSDCGWMEHMYVDKTINRCKGTVGKPYIQQIGRSKVKITKLCPASILIEPQKTQFHLTFYNQHLGHDCFVYKPTPFAAPFIVTKQKVYEKVMKIFDFIKKHALELSDNAMNVMLNRAVEMQEYMNSAREPELQPIEEVMISGHMDPLETPMRVRKTPTIKSTEDVLEKAVDAALEKYIKAKSPMIQMKPLEEVLKSPINTSTPVRKVNVPKSETAQPKIVNSFSLKADDDVESFVKDVELLVNNGKSYEVMERRSKLGKVGESIKGGSLPKTKAYLRKSLPNLQTVKGKAKEAKKANANEKKLSAQSMVEIQLSDSEDDVSNANKITFQRMATRRQSVNLPKDDTKLQNKRRLSMNMDKNKSSNQPSKPIREAKKASPYARIVTRNHSESSVTENTKPQTNRLSTNVNKDDIKAVNAKKVPTNAKTATNLTSVDAKKKATELEGKRLSNRLSANSEKDDMKTVDTKKLPTNAKTITDQSDAKKIATTLDGNLLTDRLSITSKKYDIKAVESVTDQALMDAKKKTIEFEGNSVTDTLPTNSNTDEVKTVDPKQVLTNAKTVTNQLWLDAKNKATEVEGNRLANETIKLGDDLVKVQDLVDGIIGPKKKVENLFPTSSFNDSYKHFIHKEFHVTPTVNKVAPKKSLSLEVSAEGINQSDKQIPEDTKDLVKMKRGRQQNVIKDEIFKELLGGIDESDVTGNTIAKKRRLSKAENVTNDMLIELLSEPDAVQLKKQAEVNTSVRKGKMPKDMTQVELHPNLGDERIVLTDETKKQNTNFSGEAKKLTKRIDNAGKITKSGLKSNRPISKPMLRMAASKSIRIRTNNVPNKSSISADESTERLEELGADSDATAEHSDFAASPARSVRRGKAKPVPRKVIEEKFIVKEREDDCNILIIRM